LCCFSAAAAAAETPSAFPFSTIARCARGLPADAERKTPKSTPASPSIVIGNSERRAHARGRRARPLRSKAALPSGDGSRYSAKQGSSFFFGPREAVARDQRAGRRRPPAAGRIRARRVRVVGPGVQDRPDPAPGLFLLVAAHEQVQA